MSDRPFISTETAFELIGRLLEEPAFTGRVEGDTLDAFEDMRDKGNPLSAKQLLWVQGVAVRLGMVEEPAQNEWSSRTLQRALAHPRQGSPDACGAAGQANASAAPQARA